jgi:hypothetical protein
LAGAFGGSLVGSWKGHGIRGIIIGALGGILGGIIGAIGYAGYERTLPYEIRRQEWGPYRHILNRPPPEIRELIIFGAAALAGALLVVWVTPPKAPNGYARRISMLLGPSLFLLGLNLLVKVSFWQQGNQEFGLRDFAPVAIEIGGVLAIIGGLITIVTATAFCRSRDG